MRVKSLQLKRFKWIRLPDRGETFRTILETTVTSIPSMQPVFSPKNKHKEMDPGTMYNRNRIKKQKWKAKDPTIMYIIASCEQKKGKKVLALVFQGRN